jgi:hypothetical protein
MSEFSCLTRVETEFRPFLLAGGRKEFGSAVLAWAEFGLTTRVVRGGKMRTLTGLFDECAAALQFPLYFGENKDAFDECVAGLEGLPAGRGFVVAITEPDEVLVNDGHDPLSWLVRSLASAAAVWGQPVELGEWWDRPAVPFHIVLAGEHDVVELAARRWAAAGAEPLPFPQN